MEQPGRKGQIQPRAYSLQLCILCPTWKAQGRIIVARTGRNSVAWGFNCWAGAAQPDISPAKIRLQAMAAAREHEARRGPRPSTTALLCRERLPEGQRMSARHTTPRSAVGGLVPASSEHIKLDLRSTYTWFADAAGAASALAAETNPRGRVGLSSR